MQGEMSPRSHLHSKNLLSNECAGVRRCDVTGGLCVSQCVGFQGWAPQGRGQQKTTNGGTGDPFCQACGASCTVCVGPRPEAQSATQIFPATAGGGAGLFLPTAVVLNHMGGGAWSLPTFVPSSQLSDMEGVAGGRVGRDLRLQSVDVAAVAEQVAFQWITAVALFIIQLKTTVLKE